MKKIFLLLFCLNISLVQASVIETASSWNGSESIGLFGSGPAPATPTYGQTFNLTSSDDTVLDSISVYFDTQGVNLDYHYYLYEWGGTTVNGGALFSSSIPNSITSSSMTEQALNFNGLELSSLVDYIFVVSVFDIPTVSPAIAVMGANLSDNIYSNGSFMYSGDLTIDSSGLPVISGGNPEISPWVTDWLGGTIDLAFEMNLTPSSVPAPTTFSLLILSLIGIGFSRKRKYFLYTKKLQRQSL